MSRETVTSYCWQHSCLHMPNETRLQELHALVQRKQAQVPGPGTYEVAALTAIRPCSTSHRRQHQPGIDGPFLLSPGESSLRSQQISSEFILRDSGVSPAAYDGLLKKDICMTRAPTPKMGTERRAGDPASYKGQLCLSISRSLSSGLNWAKPVSLQQLQQQLTHGSLGSAAATSEKCTARQEGLRTGSVCHPSCRCNHMSQCEVKVKEASKQQQYAVGQPHATATASAAFRPRQQQHHLQQQSNGSMSCVGSGKGCCRGDVPMQLMSSLADWEQVVAAMKKQQQQVHNSKQDVSDNQSVAPNHGSLGTEKQVTATTTPIMPDTLLQQCKPSTGHVPYETSVRGLKGDMKQCWQVAALATCKSSNIGQRQRTPGCLTKQHTSMALDQQQVLQHVSAARAAETVGQLAARRERWRQLSARLT